MIIKFQILVFLSGFMDARELIQKWMKNALGFMNSKQVSHFFADCFENDYGVSKIGGKWMTTFLPQA